MSFPSNTGTTQGSKPEVEDCRDYLRTGRCKYGASCKYNHPPNVQSGGGIKPLDPNEPLFPIRPTEPVCQYFMKHGTCKFGQACKFNHPPQNSVQMVNGSPMQIMNVASLPKREPAPQLILNPVGPDPNGQGMMVQFLPQRPDEPDCIYFLKNGRCKYGATCRYHHPIHPQQPRRIDPKTRRQTTEQFRPTQKVQYVTQMHPSYTTAGGTYVMNPDNSPVTFINMDGSPAAPPAHGYQIIHSSDGTSFCVPTGSVVVTEQGSSASSIASSYETAQETSLDSSQWSRSKRNNSGGSLSAYDGRQQRLYIPHSASDGNMSQRRARTASHGSASDHSANYFDASSSSTGMIRNSSTGSWNMRIQGGQFVSLQDPSGRPPVISSAQRRILRQRSGRGEGSDEGFTMMTSALLNMLDTPEEAAAEGYSDDDLPRNQRQFVPTESIDPAYFARLSLENPDSSRHSQHEISQAPSYVDPVMFHQLSLNQPHTSANQLSPPSMSREERSNSWSPTWQGSNPSQEETSSDNFAMMHHQPTSNAPSSQDPNVGLYLP